MWLRAEAHPNCALDVSARDEHTHAESLGDDNAPWMTAEQWARRSGPTTMVWFSTGSADDEMDWKTLCPEWITTGAPQLA